MVFEKETRRNVDVVEAGFREFKLKHPEEFEKLVQVFEVTTENSYKNLPVSLTELGEREKDRASRLAPWGYSFDLSPEISTDSIDRGRFDSNISAEGRNDYLLRMSMLSYTLEKFSIEGSWLDIATNSGIIPLMLSQGKNLSVTGIDIGDVNIEKAYFLKSLMNDYNSKFHVADAYEYLESKNTSNYDFISALGIFYHLSDPLGLLQLMHEKTKRFVLVDTIIHNFAFSGWIQTISRHVKFAHLGHANDTRKIVELHPTYRGMIDALYQVGFDSVVEILPSDSLLAKFPSPVYGSRNRRMLLAEKRS
ncbi:bifunctional 2-polyprenyl-6-hydroxyphenol methylase/3-demethylubiquinol 3-O-methyltransferase UbiG [Azospirillum sp. TSA6c]|uniref:class I SAM-dependent methyltransferase n=1 Tax=unclassified Azospirillum TaxID=2630922 RepID=UPI001304DC17|nr:methyltransferase domain-containing protein [Azospirillum sp. TSA6c]